MGLVHELSSAAMADLLGVALCLVLAVANFFRFGRRMKETAMLEGVMFITLFACAVDLLTVLFDGAPGVVARWLLFLGTTSLYVSYVTTSILWVCFLRIHLGFPGGRRLGIAFNALFTAMLIPLVVNVFVPVVFSYDAGNVYHREGLFWLYFLAMIGCAGMGVFLYVKARRVRVFRFFPVEVLMAPMAIGAAAQAVGYSHSIMWPCMAICLAGTFECLKNEEIYRDRLTHAFSRHYLEFMQKSRWFKDSLKLTGIMLDLNGFKDVNDTFGHVEGDRALIDTARIIERAVGVSGVVVRYAGDEFIVLVAEHDAERVADVMARIRQEFEQFNARGERPYQLSASMGCVEFSASDTTVDQFVNMADRQMYADKARFYQDSGNDRRKRGLLESVSARVEHTALWVADLDREREFFQLYFDATAGEEYVSSQGFKSCFLTFAGGSRLELMQDLEAVPGDGAPRCGRIGYGHIALSVRSNHMVDELTACLEADGYRVTSGPRVTGDGYYESCVLDAEGNQIEITV